MFANGLQIKPVKDMDNTLKLILLHHRLGAKFEDTKQALLDLFGVSIALPSRKDYDDRKLKPMYFQKDTTVAGKVLYLKGEEYQPYNWNYGRMIGYLHTGRLGYEC